MRSKWPSLGAADNQAVFKNLVFTRGRVTERQEAIVMINGYFNNHLNDPSKTVEN
jgi:hypothetical protein